MSFPLDIRTDLFVGGTWQDISSDVYLREVKNLTRGVRDMGSTADPSNLQLTLDNRAGKYSPRNAMSPLFGMIGRNTPLRVSLPGDGESYLQLDGRTGNYASTPDAPALDITGDLDVRAEIAPDWYGSANQLVIGKWDRASLQQSWALQIAEGRVYFRYSISANADEGGRFFSQPLPALPERAAIRVTLDVDNGAGGSAATFYWAESLDGPWELIGSVTITFGTSPIYSGSAPLTIGITDLRNGIAVPRFPMNGRAYRFEVRNGINGPVVASPDFRAVTPGSTSTVDAQGLTWTLSGSAEVRDRDDRFVGEVASWPNRWSTDDADRWAPITATGILRRLGQGAKALDSTLRRRVPSGNPIAYWPMEEEANAVQAYSPISGVLPASVSSVEWASWDTLASSAPLPRLTGTSSLSAPVPAATPGQWHVEMVYTADDKIPVGTDVELLKILSGDGAIRRWEIYLRNGRATVRGFNAANAEVITRFINVGADVFHGWVRLRFYCADQDGTGQFDWTIAWQDVGGEAGLYHNVQAGTCGSVSMVSADWPALTEGWGVGHLSVLPEAGSTLYTGSDNAYRGETATERMRRLAVEESLSFTRTPGRLDVERVGYQRLDSLVNLFEAAAEAEGGMLTEDMRRIGLHYRDRSSLYTQEPRFTLSYTAPGLGPNLEPVDDDSGITNDVTVTRDGGSSARAVLAEGPLSVQPAPDGIGKYDASHTLSLNADSQTNYHAYWRLHLGTWDAARFPTVSLMLHKPGAEWLIPLVRSLREGDKIRITDLPEWVSHDDVDLIVLGWSERLDLYTWDVELNCVPAGPWNTAITDHDTFGIADTDGSVLAGSLTETATDLVVRTVSGPQWTSEAQYLPYSIRVAGETMDVLSVGHMALPDNPYMSGGIAGWGVDTNCTVTYDTSVRYNAKATGSLRILPTAGAASGGAQSDVSAAGTLLPNTRYKAGMWVFSPTGHADIRATMHQYNAAGTFISTAGLGAANPIPANTWTWVESDFVTDANASRGRFRPRFGGTPGALPFYVWGARVFSPSDASVSDTFTTRAVTGGWGNSESGHAYSITSGGAANFNVSGGKGNHSMATRNIFYVASLPTVSLTDVEFEATVTVPVMPTGDGVYTYFMVRTDASALSYYFARVWVKTSGVAELSIRKRIPAESLLATYTPTLVHTAGQSYTVRISAVGSTIRAKFWRVVDEEPTDWQLTVVDTSLTAPGGVGVRSYISSTNTNTLPVVTAWDNLRVTDSQTFTVVRSTNGVTKSQVAGEAVNIANPAITSL